MAFEVTKQEIIKQAIALNTLWKQTRDQKYRDEELRLRRIALELENTTIGGTGVTKIIAGTGVTISPVGGTGDVTINATATTPDLQDVTDEGNTTTNAIETGGTKSDYFTFDTAATPTPTTGMMFWDQDSQTPDVQLDSQLSAKMFQDEFWYVKNQTGSTIPKGTVVMAVGTLGASSRILVAPMVADGSVSAKYILGIAAENIPDGGDGSVMRAGKIRQLDTSMYSAGAVLYANPAVPGGLTPTLPQAPNLKLAVAFVVHSATNGVLAVRVEVGSDLYEDHRVQVTSPTDGQLLRYDNTDQRWENWTPNFLTTVPTLDQVTTAGNTTANAISVGGLTGSGTFLFNDTNGVVTFQRPNTSLTGPTLRLLSTDPNSTIAKTTGIELGSRVNGNNFARIDVRGTASYNQYPKIDFQLPTDPYPYTLETKVSFRSNGNVLIGTTTDAGYKLDVNGTIRSINGAYFATTSGNVGIGNTSPTAKLDVFGNIAIRPGDKIQLSGGSDATHHIYHNATSDYDIVQYSTGFQLERNTGEIQLTVVGSSGNVGIGTASPGSRLQVDFSATNPVTSATNSGIAQIVVKDSSSVTTSGYGSAVALEGVYGALGRIAAGKFNSDTSGTTRDFGFLSFQVNGNSAADSYAALVERMRINPDGNVGINTTSPFARLHVRDGYTNTGTLAVGHQSFPGLLYSSADTGEFRIDNRSSAPSGYITFYPNGEGGTLGNEAMRIIANRNVGIGTTTPTYKLHVAGTTRNTLTRIDITPTSSTLALDIRGTGTPNDYFSVSNGTGGANDVFFPVFFYKAASYGYNGGPNRYPNGVYAGGFVAAVDDIAYNNATGAGAAMHFNARAYGNNGPLNNRALFSWGSWFTTHMVMFPTGNLVLGSQTDNGLGKLQVEGDITANTYYSNGLAGWSGVIPIPTNPPGMQNIEVTGGIITNVF